MKKAFTSCEATSAVMADSGRGLPGCRAPVSPTLADLSVLYQQALALHRDNRLDEAEFLYRQILAVEPNHPGALHFLGMVAFAQKNLPEAIRFIECSLVKCTTKPIYFNNYGVALKEAKRLEEAKNAFEEALILDPNYPDAHSNLGLVIMLLGEPVHLSEYHFRAALQFQPDHRDAMRHFIDLLFKHERYEESLPFLEQLVSCEPANAEFRHRLAISFGESGKIADAKREFQQAASLPGGKPVWKWKHLWYCPTFFESENEIDEYWKNLNDDLDAALQEKPLYDWRKLVYDGFTHSFNLPHLNRCCRDVLEKIAWLFAPSFPFERPTYTPGEKIRVGFLVTPGHEGGFLRLTAGLIEKLDSEKFEVVLIYNETTKERFDGKFHRSDLIKVPYSWNFEESVRTIRDTRCDVIYYWKVGADVWNFFLPMCHLAPIQVTSWGTHGTSGATQIDYYVSWDKAEIQEAQEHYTEKLVLFNTTPLYEPLLDDIPPKATRTELNLPETGAIYFCPHRPSKYHPVFDDYLRQILECDPTGHIVLFLGKSDRTTSQFTRRMRSVIGETLFKRVIVLPQQHVHQYYRYLSVSTVLLHSPIYAGEITAVDGFLYGVPSVTQTGELLIQRYTSAFHEDFGIENLVASNKEEYVEQAVKLGTDPDYFETICQKIQAQRSRFFDNGQTIQEWDSFLREAVETFQKTVPSEKVEHQDLAHDAESLFQRLASKYPWPVEKPDVPVHPHGWCDEPNQTMLSSLLDDSTQLVVELGSWLGSSAHFILEHAPQAKLICVDHWFGSLEHQESGWEYLRERIPTLYETFLVNLWEVRSRVVPLRTDSTCGLREIHRLGLKPDLIYIDASHDYHNAFEDMQTALDLFPGSIICGDDWHYEGVRQAASELAQEYGKTILTEGNRVWWFEKDARQVAQTNQAGISRMPQKAVPFDNLEINVAYSCNLKCRYCSHFCDRMSGLASVNELVEDFRTWSPKLAPEKIRLIGGEPLLHPELDTIIREVKKYWAKARVDLVTNGLLLPKQQGILTLLKELGGHVFLSRHFDHADYLREFDVALQCLQASGVDFTIYTSDREWRKYYELDRSGVPIHYNCDPEKAWRNCQTKNLCPTLWENRLWKCQHLAWAIHAANEGKLPESWRFVCNYQPLLPESHPDEILAFLSSGAIPYCRICPESYESVSLAEKVSFCSSGIKPDFAAS